jgi:hypothetical protein
LRALFACESGLSEPEIGLEHTFVRFVLLIWQLAIKEERQMAKFARCSFAETTANCSNSFCHFYLIDLIREPAASMAFDSVFSGLSPVS